jgi:hypothetical protein
MVHGVVIAQGGDHLSRAADHAALIGVIAVIALVGGLVYRLFRTVSNSRARRTRSDRPEGARGPKA